MTPAQYRTCLVHQMRQAVGAAARADRKYKLREAVLRKQYVASPPGELRVMLNTDIELKDAQGAGRWHMEVARTMAAVLDIELRLHREGATPTEAQMEALGWPE